MTIYKSPLADLTLRDLSITDRLFEGLALGKNRALLIDGPSGLSLTGAELRARIQSLAGGLAAQGIGSGSVIALMAPNMPDYATIFHGVAYAGATLTTINPTYTAPEIKHQLADSGAELLITIPAFLQVAEAALHGTKVREIVVIGGAEGHRSLDDLMGPPMTAQVPVDLDRHVMVLPYSSGTTGLPKGVMLSHRNLVVNVDQIIEMLEVANGETSIAFLPFFHIYGMNVLMNAFLSAGAALVTMPRFDLEALLGHIQTHRMEKLLIAPPVAIALAKHPIVDQYDLSSLKIVMSAAAPLGGEVAEAVARRIGCAVIQGYGMTELSPVTHVVPHRTPRSGSVGVTSPNARTRIVDPMTGVDCGPDEEGEVWISGPQVMIGYHNRPEATAQMIVDGWLRTGDLGVVDADGYLFIRDRLKELIKVKGFQVAPAEVEAELLGVSGVADAAVIGVPDDDAGELPMAFVVQSPGSDLTEAQVRAALVGKLASYKIPSRVEFIEAIPKSASGKILRRVLRDRVSGANA
ncbi:AMP-binding protein [Tabrizicola sp.]|uniref:AMP-binding protein n=1 Tax=Tabrizicola sp. TaxID=2005166 RepID=UPI00286C63EC|nr:AMP-binding protein [Tabrizicola sp.]